MDAQFANGMEMLLQPHIQIFKFQSNMCYRNFYFSVSSLWLPWETNPWSQTQLWLQL